MCCIKNMYETRKYVTWTYVNLWRDVLLVSVFFSLATHCHQQGALNRNELSGGGTVREHDQSMKFDEHKSLIPTKSTS